MTLRKSRYWHVQDRRSWLFCASWRRATRQRNAGNKGSCDRALSSRKSRLPRVHGKRWKLELSDLVDAAPSSEAEADSVAKSFARMPVQIFPCAQTGITQRSRRWLARGHGFSCRRRLAKHFSRIRTKGYWHRTVPRDSFTPRRVNEPTA